MLTTLLLLILAGGFTAQQAAPERSAPVRISSNTDADEDPSVMRARDGRFYVVWSSKRRNGVHLYIKRSDDGLDWFSEERIFAGAEEQYYPSLIESGNGRFHLTWFQLNRKEEDMNIWYASSRDTRTWTTPVLISQSSEPDWAPSILEDSTGELRIVWSSSQTGNRELFLSRSQDGGVNWSDEEQITHSAEEDDFPHLVETKPGDWVMAWTRYRKGSKLLSYVKDGSAEIVIARSTDGLRWSEPQVVSPPDEKGRYLDLLPFLAVDSNSQRLYLSWTSSRFGKGGDILLQEVSQNAADIHRLTESDKEDYDAKIVSAGKPGRFLMVWISNRQGKTDIYSRFVEY
jgi:hypothetical protein